MPGSCWKIRHGNKHWVYNYRPISQKHKGTHQWPNCQKRDPLPHSGRGRIVAAQTLSFRSYWPPPTPLPKPKQRQRSHKLTLVIVPFRDSAAPSAFPSPTREPRVMAVFLKFPNRNRSLRVKLQPIKVDDFGSFRELRPPIKSLLPGEVRSLIHSLHVDILVCLERRNYTSSLELTLLSGITLLSRIQ